MFVFISFPCFSMVIDIKNYIINTYCPSAIGNNNFSIIIDKKIEHLHLKRTVSNLGHVNF